MKKTMKVILGIAIVAGIFYTGGVVTPDGDPGGGGMGLIKFIK